MNSLNRIANSLSWICKQAARLAGLLLLVLTCVIMYDVIGRKFFDTGSFKLQELEWHLHGAIALLGCGYAYTRNAHVRIDVFAHTIPDRLKLWLEIWGVLLFLLPFTVLLMWFGYDFTERAFVRGETAPGGLGLDHRWIIKSVIPLSAFIAALGGISVALRAYIVLKKPEFRTSAFEYRGLWNS